jgi:hypothetical protein
MNSDVRKPTKKVDIGKDNPINIERPHPKLSPFQRIKERCKPIVSPHWIITNRKIYSSFINHLGPWRE